MTRAPSDAAYRRAIRLRRSKIKTLIDDLAHDDITPSEFSDKFKNIVQDAHTVAARMGRQRAGDLRIKANGDIEAGQRAIEADDQYFQNFAKDLADGRYGAKSDLDVEAVDRRAYMYLDKARSTANDAFGENSPDQAWDRVMLAVEHCETCPRKAGHYPTWSALKAVGLPADGSDQCLTSCECIVVRADDTVGFSKIFEKEFPQMTEDGHIPQDALIPRAKLGYLTNFRSTIDKSGLMAQVGYTKHNKDALLAELRRMTAEYPAQKAEMTQDGQKWVVEGDMVGPLGSHPMSLKFIEDPRRGMKFTTLTPPKKKR